MLRTLGAFDGKATVKPERLDGSDLAHAGRDRHLVEPFFARAPRDAPSRGLACFPWRPVPWRPRFILLFVMVGF
jgi:hypothetical protein